MHLKGHAALETKAAAERARLLIEQAEALGEAPEDPLQLFSVLYSFWVANFIKFSGDLVRELATQFLGFAEKQGTIAPLIIGHRLLGVSLLHTGDITKGRVHLDCANALNDPMEHRPLATRFGVDARVAILSYRSFSLWLLGYPDAALGDTEQALNDAREIGQAPTLMHALAFASSALILCGNYRAADAPLKELVALADEKSASFGRHLECWINGAF
jgi:hypothetical protein